MKKQSTDTAINESPVVKHLAAERKLRVAEQRLQQAEWERQQHNACQFSVPVDVFASGAKTIAAKLAKAKDDHATALAVEQSAATELAESQRLLTVAQQVAASVAATDKVRSAKATLAAAETALGAAKERFVSESSQDNRKALDDAKAVHGEAVDAVLAAEHAERVGALLTPANDAIEVKTKARMAAERAVDAAKTEQQEAARAFLAADTPETEARLAAANQRVEQCQSDLDSAYAAETKTRELLASAAMQESDARASLAAAKAEALRIARIDELTTTYRASKRVHDTLVDTLATKYLEAFKPIYQQVVDMHEALAIDIAKANAIVGDGIAARDEIAAIGGKVPVGDLREFHNMGVMGAVAKTVRHAMLDKVSREDPEHIPCDVLGYFPGLFDFRNPFYGRRTEAMISESSFAIH